MGGLDVEKGRSRGRSFRFSFTAGAGYSDAKYPSNPRLLRAWKPVGSASASMGLSGSWSLEGRYVREFSLMQGVAEDVFTTDTVSLTAGGFLAGRTELQLGAVYSNWTTLLTTGMSDRIDIYGASAQIRVPLTRNLAATTSYNYYFHRFSSPGALPVGFPAEYNRNAVRVGLSLWVPLSGTPAQRPLNQR